MFSFRPRLRSCVCQTHPTVTGSHRSPLFRTQVAFSSHNFDHNFDRIASQKILRERAEYAKKQQKPYQKYPQAGPTKSTPNTNLQKREKETNEYFQDPNDIYKVLQEHERDAAYRNIQWDIPDTKNVANWGKNESWKSKRIKPPKTQQQSDQPEEGPEEASFYVKEGSYFEDSTSKTTSNDSETGRSQQRFSDKIGIAATDNVLSSVTQTVKLEQKAKQKPAAYDASTTKVKPGVRTFLQRPMFTPVNKADVKYQPEPKVKIEKTDISVDLRDPIDIDREKEDMKFGTHFDSLLEVDPITGAEIGALGEPKLTGFKDDALLAGHPMEAVTDALTTAASIASHEARKSGQPVSLNPFGHKEGRKNVQELVEDTFMKKLEMESKAMWYRRQRGADVQEDTDTYYTAYFEHLMKHYYQVGVALDCQDNPRLDIKIMDATRIYKAIARRQKWTIKKHKRWEIFRARRVAKYGEKNKIRREKNKVKRMEFREMAANSPDWIYLSDWACWVEKKDLLRPHVQGVYTALKTNPSYSNEHKRRMLQLTIDNLKRAENTSPEFIQQWEEAFGDFIKTRVPQSGQKSPPDEWCEEDAPLPKTYEGIIAAAEAEIPHEDIKRKYEPPTHPYPKPIQY